MSASNAGKRVAHSDFPLFVPGDRPDRLVKAITAARDSVIIDLEDAVAPAAKEQARISLAGETTLLGDADLPVFVRVNGVGTPWHDDDIALCAGLPIAGVMLPKADSASSITLLRERLPGREIIALVESAAGVADLRGWARQADRIAFGSIDYSADLGCAEDRMALLGARSEIVLASKLAGLPAPVDGVTTAVRDAERIRQDAEHAMRLGFGGKLIIHPGQLAPAIAGFAPTDQQRQWAEKVLAAGQGGASAMDGQMIDAPVVAQARAILARVAGQ